MSDNQEKQAPENQWLTVGPPGCGKSSYIARQATRAAEKFGANKVLLSSFTKAATVELASRDVPIDDDMIGTLHSFAFHSLGRPPIAESKIKDWNEEYAKTGEYRLSPHSDEPESGGKTPGDDLYNRIQINRARMIPLEEWPMELRAFHYDWCKFKTEGALYDFTDLIEIALREVDTAPNNPTVGMFDESQDNTKLENALISKWGASMDYFFLAGDSDQTIFSFKGADPNAFLDMNVPKERTRLLTQSYRVPRQVHAVAKRWIETLSRRYPSLYLPRRATEAQPDAEGSVIQAHDLTFKNADRLIDHAEQYLAQGKEVMFLGACGFHVSPVVEALRKRGLPFWNPFRRKRGDWNPLGRTKGTSTIDRVRSFLEGDAKLWSVHQLQQWIELVKVDGVLVRGMKKEILALGPDSKCGESELRRWFTPQSLRAAIARDTRWLGANLATKCAPSGEYALSVVAHRGIDALHTAPKIVVGTIHSVKGSQSQVVIVDPSLSSAMMREWHHPVRRLRDPIIRQFYVSFTRASETLVVCNSDSHMVDIDCSVPEKDVEEF